MSELKIKQQLNLDDLGERQAHLIKQKRKGQLPALTAREVAALESGAKIIPLTRGKWAIVDAEDYAEFSQYLWTSQRQSSVNTKKFYAVRCLPRNGQKSAPRLLMHRAIFSEENEGQIDHKNSDCLDNRRANLRPANSTQNKANAEMQSNNTSGFRGVSWLPSKRRWVASIVIGGRRKYLGMHASKEKAHAVYCAEAKIAWGEYARLK